MQFFLNTKSYIYYIYIGVTGDLLLTLALVDCREYKNLLLILSSPLVNLLVPLLGHASLEIPVSAFALVEGLFLPEVRFLERS